MTHVELESAKYWNEAFKDERKAHQKSRSYKALHDFAIFVFGLGAMAFGTWVVQEHARWEPAVQAFLASF